MKGPEAEAVSKLMGAIDRNQDCVPSEVLAAYHSLYELLWPRSDPPATGDGKQDRSCSNCLNFLAKKENKDFGVCRLDGRRTLSISYCCSYIGPTVSYAKMDIPNEKVYCKFCWYFKIGDDNRGYCLKMANEWYAPSDYGKVWDDHGTVGLLAMVRNANNDCRYFKRG